MGTEFDWFCIDRVGQIGIFSSAGFGPIPEMIFRSCFEAHNSVLAIAAARPPVEATLATTAGGNLLDWDILARHGLFAFDYQDTHRTFATQRGGYDLIYRPSAPLLISDLPAKVASSLPSTSLVFGEEDLIPFEALGCDLPPSL